LLKCAEPHSGRGSRGEKPNPERGGKKKDLYRGLLWVGKRRKKGGPKNDVKARELSPESPKIQMGKEGQKGTFGEEEKKGAAPVSRTAE